MVFETQKTNTGATRENNDARMYNNNKRRKAKFQKKNSTE